MINLAKCLRAYLEDNSNNIELPFIHKFPMDCCEVTTLIFALAISQNKLSSKYVVAKGYDRANDAWHYWLESEGNIIDITADQFGRDLLSKNEFERPSVSRSKRSSITHNLLGVLQTMTRLPTPYLQ